MAEFEPRPLHLHTLDSLLADLIGGRAILVGEETYFLPNDEVRSALQWYKGLGPIKWRQNLNAAETEKFVDAIRLAPPKVPLPPAKAANSNGRRLTLKRLEAHRFAGLHRYGTPSTAPENYTHEFSSALTLLEGRNGSGKTSLANAIIWVLTGELLRPQRVPEKTDEDFLCWVDGVGDEEPTVHRISPVTPIPDVADFRPDKDWIPADTWVELTFEDENRVAIGPIRRTQTRTAKGKIVEESNVSDLGLDPIGTRIGTVMPGLLSLIKVGAESELGRAVSELTGLSALIDLADHCRRAKHKIDKEFTKAREADRATADNQYNVAKADIEKLLVDHPALRPTQAIPAPSHDPSIEASLEGASTHFERLKTDAFRSAQGILGTAFDPENAEDKLDLENDVGPALSELAQLARLSSFQRLRALGALSSEELGSARKKLDELRREAAQLEALAGSPDTAARVRLYARIAAWMIDHPDPNRDPDACLTCGKSIVDVTDPVTGKLVKTHIDEAMTDGALLALTIKQWAQAALNEITASLPDALQRELGLTLPSHPSDLVRAAIVDELFQLGPFSGVLASLKTETARNFDEFVKTAPPLAAAERIELPAECGQLAQALVRLETALRFSDWRHKNDTFAKSVSENVIGRRPKEGEAEEKITLTGKLLDLSETVKAAKPLSDALDWCGRLSKHLAARRTAEVRIAAYEKASTTLQDLIKLGELADRQVDELRRTLSGAAAEWRRRIYLGAFPTIAPDLVDAPLGRDGELDLHMRAGGVVAPAQHITNASALRAGLVGFFLAFWMHVLNERGGIKLLVLDDPQELLDDENRERLASALAFFLKSDTQLVATSYDARFADYVVKSVGASKSEHLEVLPATRLQPTIRTGPARSELNDRKAAYEADLDAEGPARNYVGGCRVFVENRLGDMFEDAAFSTWRRENPHPAFAAYVSRLRKEVRSAGPQSMFAAPVFKQFVDHSALVDASAVIILMNKAHHGQMLEIRAGDVAPHVGDLDQIAKLAEEMWDECRRWRRRDAVEGEASELPADLTAMVVPKLNVVVCPDLAAFTLHQPGGETQEAAEPLDVSALEGKAAFYLRRDNFGFAAPQGSLAIVEAVPTTVNDRRLVVARHGGVVYARRFLRSANSNIIGLTAETLDPRTRTPKTVFLPEKEVALHQVAGVIFEHDVTLEKGSDEAVEIDGSEVLRGVQVAFRVVDESAVPLALPQQVVLGGRQIELAELNSYKGRLVALYLSDGSSIFKRVGGILPGELSHLRQFESIGGLGSSQILSVGQPHVGFQTVIRTRLIIGVLYRG